MTDVAISIKSNNNFSQIFRARVLEIAREHDMHVFSSFLAVDGAMVIIGRYDGHHLSALVNHIRIVAEVYGHSASDAVTVTTEV